MKAIVAAFGILLAAIRLVGADENIQWPGAIVTYAHDARKRPEGLDERFPERFDWERYIVEHGQSTIDQRELALMACSILWKRLVQLETEMKDQWSKMGDYERVQLFEAMQNEWRELSGAECRYMAGPPNEPKGSGFKAYFPSFVAEQIQARIKWLQVERW